MPRPEKVQAVAEIRDRLDRASAVFLAEYAGLSVADQQDLRRRLRRSDAEFKVVKMTLARRAAADLEIEGLDDVLLGPTGITFADGDAVVAAKALRDFASSHEVFSIKGGLLGREFLTPERVARLADIEPREVLLAKIAGAVQAPMAKMARLLAALPSGFASALKQLIDKLPADGAAERLADPAAPEPTGIMAADEAASPEPEGGETAPAETGEDTEAESGAPEPAPEDSNDDDAAETAEEE